MANLFETNAGSSLAVRGGLVLPCALANYGGSAAQMSAARPEVLQHHESVLVAETLAALHLRENLLVVDATAGQGGHAEAILKAAAVRLIAFDADPDAVRFTRERLAPFGNRAEVVEANFRNLAEELAKKGVGRIDRAVFDFGWNRTQLAGNRGFSFQTDAPLNMSYGREPASGFTAGEIVNTWSEETLGNVLFGYGNERYARRIARLIVEHRRQHAIESTSALVELVERAVPAAYRRGRLHVATKTFQALRMAVNDELGSIERGIRDAWQMLAPGGRIAAITFHSVEDGLVKSLFAACAREGGELVTKKLVVPSREEISRNSAARSAKLRAIIKH
ncbi:MAG: 16S rRNA (cytosine(1402)-N(4))-methyltransferase RsmH [Minisyncoccia bacterium]